ncbi:MFS transporter [Serpentinicella sp. ANB-PHB4]|uniref:MFS transporter n=1 Tax=Serpentinicella sp. ANB-PHB4 TaxID=3074076 RepID=UPI0028544CFC|nr:MFS transporter [Serpentinicella sp. ANB-PHB4]MDR5658728.1 MFS transporter [Serpentinicella sp. ANB-PHB4]
MIDYFKRQNDDGNNSSIYYGWVIVAIAALGVFFSGPGQTYSVSIFINYYVENLGWSRTLVSSYYSFATLTAGLMIPIIGRKIDKLGHRKMMSLVAFLLALACLWMSFVTQPIMLFVGFLCLRLFGQGSMTLIPSTLVPQWFINKRGKALSLMALGGVAGSTLLPIINNYLIGAVGVNFTWRVWTVLLMTVMMPVAYGLVRNKPEDIGIQPDGNEGLKDTEDLINTTIEVDYDRSWTVKEAIRTRAFWLMLFCSMVPAMVNTGITFHMISILGIQGFDSNFAALVLSITAMVQLPLTFLAGHIVDRVQVHYVKGLNFIILLIAVILLLYGVSSKILIIYAILHGTFVAFDSVSTGVLWPNYFGRENLGSIRGITMTAMVIGSALGPLPFGYFYDQFGGYREILLIMLIFPILSSLFAFISPKPINENILE